MAGKRIEPGSTGWANGGAAALLVLVAFAVAARSAGAAEIRDAGIRAGLRAYEAGEYERAVALLEEGVREAGRRVAVVEAEYPPADPRVIAARMESAEGWRFLGFARAALGDEARAADAFREALRLDPGLTLDAATTSPKILDLFRAVRAGGGAAMPPGAAAGWQGPEHRPPLFCLKGNPVTLYAALASGERVEDLSLVYAIGSPAGEPFRMRALAETESLARWEIPAGVTLGGRDLYYRLEEVGLGGRVRASPWIPLAVVSSLAGMPGRFARLRADYSGPALEAVARTKVEVHSPPPGPLPRGVTSVDGSARALRSEGGVISGLRSVLGDR